MRAAGRSGLQPRKWRRATIRVPGVRVADDLLERSAAPGLCIASVSPGPRQQDDAAHGISRRVNR
jgi:hypothetical protein